MKPFFSAAPKAVTFKSVATGPSEIQFNPSWEVVGETPSPTEPAIASGDQTPAIVIAEDDPIARETVSSVANTWGFRTIVTQDGHEAMAAIRAEKGPVVAIIDWVMPGMDGLQVCRRIREIGKAVHIILLTSRGAKENLVEGFATGADDYLVKPFDKNELFARVNVGIRIINLQTALANRVKELEHALQEVEALRGRLSIPL